MTATICLETATVDTQVAPRATVAAAYNRAQTSRGTAAYLVQATRTIDAAWKRAIEDAGGVLRGYIPHNAFLVELTPTALTRVEASKDVAWVGAYQPAYKLSRALHDQRLRPATRAAQSSQYEIVVQTLARADVAAVCAAVVAAGGAGLASGGEVDGLVRARRAGMAMAEIETE